MVCRVTPNAGYRKRMPNQRVTQGYIRALDTVRLSLRTLGVGVPTWRRRAPVLLTEPSNIAEVLEKIWGKQHLALRQWAKRYAAGGGRPNSSARTSPGSSASRPPTWSARRWLPPPGTGALRASTACAERRP
jgi:hypothetical protein